MPTTEAIKTLGKGTIVKIDGVAVGRVETLTLPPREYAEVEAPELNPQDNSGTPLAIDPVELGDEIPGEFEFDMYYAPRNAKALDLDTKFGAKTEIDILVVTPHAGESATIGFSGLIKKLTHPQLSKRDYYKRTITIIRTTAITNIATP